MPTAAGKRYSRAQRDLAEATEFYQDLEYQWQTGHKRYLRDLGCDNPDQHTDSWDIFEHTPRMLAGSASHKCPLRRNLPVAKRELRRCERERKLLGILGDGLDGDGRLPNKVVILILEQLASGTLRELCLESDDSLDTAVKKLIGDSQQATRLHGALAESILRCVDIRMPVAFKRLDAAMLASLPRLTKVDLSSIRSLVLHMDVDTHSQYPMELYHAIDGFPDLARQPQSQMPSLQTFTLRLRVAGQQATRVRQQRKTRKQVLESQCSASYNSITTYGAVTEKLIKRIQTSQPGEVRWLKLHFPAEQSVAGTERVKIDERGAKKILEQAIQPVRCGHGAVLVNCKTCNDVELMPP